MQVYRGEAVSYPVDLDTSVANDDYDLAVYDSVSFRASQIGSDAAFFVKEMSVDNTGEGRLSIDMTEAETATFAIGIHDYQVVGVRSGTPTVLAEGSLIVGRIIASEVPQ